jgi:phosphoenolpyruvate phosphomutase
MFTVRSWLATPDSRTIHTMASKVAARHCSGLPAKAKQLKTMIKSDKVEFLMEAHSGISAKIVEEAGFKAIWGSGLSLSASLGVRDNNEASWTQCCDVWEYMSNATTIPMLVDADTGYGNFNNARMLVRKLEQIGVAGACIEDKLFPKTNSLLDERSAQPLADMKEFANKITAMKDTQTDENFCVVARIESFIAGWPLEEALKRADAYATAGADALLVHSKKSDPSDIEAFMKNWDRKRCPIVIVPTNYPTTPVSRFQEIGISSVIWANHNIRASIAAMQATTKKIYEDQSLVTASKGIATVKEVFRLQNQQEYLDAEEKYLPKQ